MTLSVYDQMGDFYYEFVQRNLASPESVLNLAKRTLMERVGDVRGAAICDLACGEGHVARSLAQAGAHVTAVDLSSNLLEHARRQSQDMAIIYVQDDAQALTLLSQAAFDVVVSNMAMMDIPQLDAILAAVHRILRQDGRFLFTMLHPCFESPFHVSEKPIEVDAQGNFVACRVTRYAEEGRWYSGGTGMRGTHGAYHRTLSTYINTLIATGFAIVHMAEPLVPASDLPDALIRHENKIPRVLMVEAQKL